MFNRKLIGTVKSTAPTAIEQQLGNGLLSAVKNMRPADTTGPGPRAPIDTKKLIPKEPKLSPSQLATLQKLRWGQTKDLSYRGDGEDATVRLLSSTALAAPADAAAPLAESAEDMAIRFVTENRELFLLKDPAVELVVKSVESDSLVGTIVRLGQRFAGFEVWPCQLLANVSPAGYLTVVTGTYSPTPDSIDLRPEIDRAEAVSAAFKYLGLAAETTRVGMQAPQLMIFADKGRSPSLAFEVKVNVPGKEERIFVNALNGVVLLTTSTICDLGTVTTATDLFGQSRTIAVVPQGTPQRYYLSDTTKPMYSATTGTGAITVYDASVTAIPVATSATLVGGYDPAAVSAAYNLGKIYDFYSTIFNRVSFDGKGSTVRGLVRSPDPGTRGPMANAFWSSQNQWMEFGAADNYPGAADVIGHEYTHAIVSTTANLVYNGESGALNESFADIMGEAFERYLNGTNDWLIGTQLRATLRSMKDPRSKGQPATMSQYSRVSADNGGVHTNSGIPNYAFYLLAEGITGPIGFDNARNIFYRALATKLNARSDFHDLRAACLLSATELFGPGSIHYTRTGQAFDAVEIYDYAADSVPQNLSPPTGPDSYLITYQAVDGNNYLGRREAALGDGTSVKAISLYAMTARSRASVTGDGSRAGFVTSTYDVAFALTDGSYASVAGFPGRYNSLAQSSDGNYIACIARDPSTGLAIPKFLYINLTTGTTEALDLYLPVADGPNSITISAVDEVDLSPDGQIALFDGLAKTSLADGTKIQSWSVFAIDLHTKSIYTLAGPLLNINIGSPSFARTSGQRLVIEAFDATSSYVIAYDLSRSVAGPIQQFTPANSFLAYPRFSAADDFLVFTDQFFSLTTFSTQPRVSRISLAADRITAVGASTVLQGLAYGGLSYRRGVFAGPPVLRVSALAGSLKNGQSGGFRVTRISGDQNIAVPLSFKVLGTAKPNTDYNQISLYASIPARASFVDIPVRASTSPSAGSHTLTLSLDLLSHYVIASGGGEASVAIVADAAAPIISAQPLSQTALGGSSVTFSVGTTDPAATFQWFKNGILISGATSRTLTINGVTATTAGSYTVRVSNSAGSSTSNAATLVVTPPNQGRLINLSVLTDISVAGDNFTLGYVVGGNTTTAAKALVIRAAGPSLGALGVPGTLNDPKLELFAGSTKIGENDNWGGSAQLAAALSAVGAFAYIGPTSKDAAMTADITSRDNSVKVSAVGSGTGQVIAEIYDATSQASFTSSTPRLINVSVRKHLGTGLTMGFVVGGATTVKVLVRGIGPTLAAFGVPGTVVDPQLTLFNSASVRIGNNNDWGGTAELTDAFANVGAFALPSTSKDAALVVTLAPGNYTAQVTGVNGTSGVALVEVYEVP